MPGLGTSFGRGGATTAQQDPANADCILIEGSSMAEAHPVGFRWVMKAKEQGATIIHVDPRFSRTARWPTFGYQSAPVNAIGLFAAAVETVLLIWLRVNKHGAADRAIHEHVSGWLIRIGEVLTGPIPLVLRFLARSRWRRFSF